MSVLVKNLGEFLNLLVQAFNLSSTFPALVFVLLLRLHALSLLPDNSPLRTLGAADSASTLAAAAVVVALLAYLLDAANLYIVRFLEGYPLSKYPPFSKRLRANQEFVRTTVEDIRELEQWADRLLRKMERTKGKEQERARRLYDKVTQRRVEFVEWVADKYPEDPDYVLPFEFGNIIAAAEYYPHKVLGMDAVTLWPFLTPILTKKDYAQFVVRSKAVMDFLVNLLVVLAFFGVVVALTEAYVLGWSMNLARKLAVIGATCSIVFMLALQGAAIWGATIRTAFVLFREDLREALRLRRPSTYADERTLWEDTSEFLGARESAETQLLLGHAIFNSSSYSEPAVRKEAK